MFERYPKLFIRLFIRITLFVGGFVVFGLLYARNSFFVGCFVYRVALCITDNFFFWQLCVVWIVWVGCFLRLTLFCGLVSV